MKPFKLRTNLTLFYAAVSTLILATASILFYNLLAYQLDRSLRDELSERTAALRGYLHFEGDQAIWTYDPSDPSEAFFIGNATRYFQIYDAFSGAVIQRSEQIQALGFEYTPDEVKELVLHGSEFSEIDTEQVNILLHNDIVRTLNGRAYLLQSGSPLTLRTTALNRLLHIILWLLPSGIILAVLSGIWMSRRALRPLELLSAAAREMTISQLHRRLPITGNRDELDRLAETFNDMFGRLEKAVEQMKDFTASISHELRTPLTALRGEAEVALVKARTESDYRRVLESQLEEFAKLSRMIDQMLTLARAEAGQIKLAREIVNLSELTQSLVDQMEIVAASKAITLTVKQEADVMVTGDAGWLERAILNLLDNAIKFTPVGGRVDLRVSSESSHAVLEVADNGIGIAAQALPHIFERFYRGDPSRSREREGAGLGLSLVEWIVRQHQGSVSVESQPGKGAVLRILLPGNPSAAAAAISENA
jgi:heavy metal sensor kinase